MQPVRGIEETRPPAGGKTEPSGLFFSVWVPPARNVYRGSCRFDPYGNRSGADRRQWRKQESEAGAVASRMRVPFRARSSRWEPQPVTARPPIGGKQQSSGLLFSARVPPARNVYRGCCIMQPVRGIEGTRPPAGGKKEPSGLFFSVWVPPARNVYRGCCRFDPYGNLSYIIQDRLFSKNKIYLR